MTKPTLSTRLRAAQDELTAINNDLTVILDDAAHIGLVPFRLVQLEGAILDNQHVMRDLAEIASALELSDPNHKL